MSTKIAVTSKSFSKNKFLRETLLKKYPDTKFNEDGLNFAPQELIAFLKDAEKAIVGLEKINHEVLSALPKLKHVSKYGVGLDSIDLPALLNHKVLLSWKGGVNRRGVAELALCFMIDLIRGVHLSNANLQAGAWLPHIGLGLREVKVGIVGLGHVGQELALILNFLGAKVIAHDIMDKSEFAKTNKIEMLSLEHLLKNSDIVSLHLPFTSKTKNLLDQHKLKLMKKGSFLINTARGGIVDEKALYQNLQTHLGGAAFDVFEEEPCKNKELLTLRNFIGTPHIAGSAQESVLAMGMAAIEGLEQGQEAKWENFFSF